MNPRPRVLDELGVELMRAAATVLDPDTTTPTLTRSPVARAIIARRLRGISTLAASATVAIAVVAAVVLLIRTHQTAPDGRGANQPQLADRPTAPRILLQATYTAAGMPLLVANADGGSSQPLWQICSPRQPCRAESPTRSRTSSRHASQLTPGTVPPGTRFRAVLTEHERRYLSYSPTWLGTVRATRAPRIRGAALAGATVTPVGARWSGGWGRDFDALGIQACRTPHGGHCVTLSISGKPYRSGRGRATVPQHLAGWYLIAVDRRYAHQAAFALPGYTKASAVPPAQAAATVALSQPLGPIQRNR